MKIRKGDCFIVSCPCCLRGYESIIRIKDLDYYDDYFLVELIQTADKFYMPCYKFSKSTQHDGRGHNKDFKPISKERFEFLKMLIYS